MAKEKGDLFSELNAVAGVGGMDCELHVVEDNPAFDADWYDPALSEVLFGGRDRLDGVSDFLATMAIFGYELKYHIWYDSRV